MSSYGNEPRRTGVSPGILVAPNTLPGDVKRGTALAVIASVDSATSPKFATVLVDNHLPGESGYTIPAGWGPFAAGGTSGYNYFYNNSSGTGGSWVLVDCDRRTIVALGKGVSDTAATPYYQAITDHKHSGNLNPDGYANPQPVSLSGGESSGQLPYSQNSSQVQGIVSSGGNVIATDFPGGLQQIVSGTYAGWCQQTVTQLWDNHAFVLPTGMWLFMDWTALNVNGAGASNQDWGPMVKDPSGNIIVWDTASNQAILKKWNGTTWTTLTTISSPAPGTNNTSPHVFTMGVQYIGGTTYRYQLIIDGAIIGDYMDSSSVLTSASLTPGFLQDGTTNVYIRTFNYYTQNPLAEKMPSGVTVAASGTSFTNGNWGATIISGTFGTTLTFSNMGILADWVDTIDITYTKTGSGQDGKPGVTGVVAVHLIPGTYTVTGSNTITLSHAISLPAGGSGWDMHVWVSDSFGNMVQATPTVLTEILPVNLPIQAMASMPSGATITATGISETVYEGGMHTLLTKAVGFVPLLFVNFTLGDANSPAATTWGTQFIGYIRQNGTTTWLRIPQGKVSSSSLTNGSNQSIHFQVTPGYNYDVGVALADGQGNETPMVTLVTNYAINKVQSGDPVGPIWGKLHHLPIATDPTNGTWNGTTGTFDRTVHHPDFTGTINSGGGVNFNAAGHTGTLPRANTHSSITGAIDTSSRLVTSVYDGTTALTPGNLTSVITTSGTVDVSKPKAGVTLPRSAHDSSLTNAIDTSSRLITSVYDGTTALSPANLTSVITTSGTVDVSKPKAGVTLPRSAHDSSLTNAIDTSSRLVGSVFDGTTALTPSNFTNAITNAGLVKVANATGTLPRANTHSDFTSTVNAGGGVNFGVAGHTGTLPQANHDPSVLWGSATGRGKNLVPDSDLLFGFGNGYWVGASGSQLGVTPNYGGGGSNAFYYQQGATAGNVPYDWVKSANIYLQNGNAYTLSGFIDATHVSGTSLPIWGIYDVNVGTAYNYISQTAGVAGRVSTTFVWNNPTGNYVLIADTGGAYVSANGLIIWSEPQIESGSYLTAYRANIGTGAWNNNTWPYGIHHSAFRNVIDSNSNILNVEFNGGKLQADGSITGIDGAQAKWQFTPINNGSVVHIEGIFQSTTYPSPQGFDLGNVSAYYGIHHDGAGNAYFVRYVSSTSTVIGPTLSVPSDGNPHFISLTLTFNSDGSRTLEATVDSQNIYYTDPNGSSLSFVPNGSLYIYAHTGNSGGSIRSLKASMGTSHHTKMPASYQGNFDSGGNWSKSSSFKNVLPCFQPYTTDANITVTFNTGSAPYTAYYAVYGASGVGTNCTFYNPDNTTQSAPYLGTSTTATGSMINSGYSTSGGSYVYYMFYYKPGDTSGVNGTGWHVTFQGTQFTATQIKSAYQDGGYIAVVATTSGGGITASSGGTGTAGGCPEEHQTIERLNSLTGDIEYVEARQLRQGDFLRDPIDQCWNKILKPVTISDAQIWEVTIAGETVRVDGSHLFMDAEDKWVNVQNLTVGHKMHVYPGGEGEVEAVRCIGPGRFVHISCERMRYVLGKTVSHNVKQK